MRSVFVVLLAFAFAFETVKFATVNGALSDVETRLNEHYRLYCEDGENHTHTGSKYVFVNLYQSQGQANVTCLNSKLTLVTLRSKLELDEFYGQFPEHGIQAAWVLASNCQNHLEFHWGYGGPVLERDDPMWFQGNGDAVKQPNEDLINGGSSLADINGAGVVVMHGGLWDINSSFKYYNFACECPK